MFHVLKESSVVFVQGNGRPPAQFQQQSYAPDNPQDFHSYAPSNPQSFHSSYSRPTAGPDENGWGQPPAASHRYNKHDAPLQGTTFKSCLLQVIISHQFHPMKKRCKRARKTYIVLLRLSNFANYEILVRPDSQIALDGVSELNERIAFR